VALTPGTRLGPYEVAAQIGVGGMGEVYRATDTNLGRQVAIKVLPTAFAQDADRLARFEREARTLASLNHTNIAQIYGLERSDGTTALVMELIEGPTLADRIAQGAIPIDDALPIARQIAEALEAAHEHGMIHRDLKPANIKLRPDGTVKVLDFGLAKALESSPGATEVSQSPTITSPAMTGMGVILGTAAYMSPEQAKGRPVDKRADIWAFGCVLYEMLSGKRAFDGETVAETLAAVMKSEPRWDALPRETPPQVRTVLRRCLQKDQAQRIRDIGDARLTMEGVFDSAAPAAAIREVPKWRKGFAWIVAGLFALTTIVMVLAGYFARPSEPPRLSRFPVEPPPGVRLPPGATPYPTVSPDGRYIAFVGISEGLSRLLLRPIGSLSAQPIPGTEGAGEYPFWSPDSRFIGFFAGGKLKKVAVSAGTPVPLCDATPGANSGTWSADDVILFAHQGSVHRVAAGGGACVPIRTPDKSKNEVSHLPMSFLPDGRHFLYVTGTSALRADLRVGSLDSSNDTPLLFRVFSRVLYANSGHLLFVRDGTLMAQRFDASRLSLTGDMFPVAEGIAFSVTGNAAFSVSGNRTLVYRTAVAVTSQFLWFDRTGKPLGSAGEAGNYTTAFDLSHDGKQIAVSQIDPATSLSDVWLIDWARGVPQKLTFNVEQSGRDVVWSPNGLQIAHNSFKKDGFAIVAKNASGVGEEATLLESPNRVGIEDWSKDGRYIAYVLDPGTGATDINVVPLFGDRKAIPITQTRFNENEPHFSFDGKWLAYDSNESGTWQVYVVSFPALDQRCQVSASGGGQPRWRRDGKELYYLAADGKLMAVNITAGLKIDCGQPQELFDTGLRMNPAADQYAVAADGQRFLVLKPQEVVPTPLTVVLNWDADIQK
jgi:Tol biopolymer transport system component